jgi:hypothetical protein
MKAHGRVMAMIFAVLIAVLFLSPRQVSAYRVGPAVSLDKMIEMADLIAKGTVVSSDPSPNSPLPPVPGFDRVATTFRVISILKGTPGGETFNFHHYSEAPTGRGFAYMPQHYEFTNGQAYIVFARKTNTPPIFEALWRHHTSKEDQGVFRAANSQSSKAESVKEVCWQNLVALCCSTNRADVLYAVRQLDQMSGGRWGNFIDLHDFGREQVVDEVRPLFSSKDQELVTAAVEMAASRNPLGSPVFWLSSVRKGHLPGFAEGDVQWENRTAKLLSPELIRLAGGTVGGTLRAKAIRALGRSHVTDLPLERWAKDPEPLVREAAVVLATDYPGNASERLIRNAAGDSSSQVRKGAALAIGFGQLEGLLPNLETLLGDRSEDVRQVATMALLSFRLSTSGDIMRRNLAQSEYRTLLVNALATLDPKPYLRDLEKIIAENLSPARFWGGRIPSADSWDILFKYIQSTSTSELQSGKLDQSLDALEKMKWYSSSEPRDLYALYLQRGLTDRAKAFRDHCRSTFTYDIDYFFKMAEKSPATYQRQ